MRVLLVVHGFPPAAQGGTELYAAAHARTLRDRFGDDVFVLTREQDPSRPQFATRVETDTRPGITVGWINNTFRRARRFDETYANPAIDAAAAGLIEEFDPDVAHVHHLTCLSTGIVRTLADRSVPAFMTLHDYWLICHRGQLLDDEYRVCKGPEPAGCAGCLGEAAGIGPAGFAGAALLRSAGTSLPPLISRRLMGGARRLGNRLASRRRSQGEARRRLDHMRQLCGKVTMFFAPSEHLRRRFIDFGIPAERIRMAPYGIEALCRPADRGASKTLRLGFVGSLMTSKAPHLAIEAIQRLPPGAVSLDIFGGYAAYHGDDTYWHQLARWVRNPRVRFHGAVPHDRIREALSAFDVLVVPSIWPETSPIVIREALSAGIPVVASRIGGIPETVQDGVNGLLFQPGDAADLHRVLSRFVDEPALLDRLRRGIETVRTIEEDVALTRGVYGVRPGSDRGQTGVRPGSDRGQTGVRPGSDRDLTPRTTAIVLSFGSPDQAILAARSVQASRSPVQLVVVDNGSRTRCRVAFAKLGESVRVIQTGSNLGFSGGMNVGIREALANGATHVFLVNSDTIVPPDALELLHDALESTGAGIAGPVILSRSVPDRVGTVGISYRPSTGRMRHRSFGAHVPSMDSPATTVVDAVSGCAMLVRREVIEAVGLLDEQYFFSFEDLDLCFRARRAGFATVLAARATAYHEGGRSMGPRAPQRLYYAARNHLRFAAQEDPRSFFRTSSIIALNVAHAIRAGGASLPVRLAAVVRGTRDHFAGRYGPERVP
jgi:GT2 family glycosyltransferase/glycosyltransferase involved in cell wall biosynthesis